MTFDAPDLFAKAVLQKGHYVSLRAVARSPLGKSHRSGTCRCGATLDVFFSADGSVSARGTALSEKHVFTLPRRR